MRPTLIAFAVSANDCQVWCPYCCRWHLHSYDKLEKTRATHRAAHCSDGPFLETGYYIKLCPKKEWARLGGAG